MLSLQEILLADKTAMANEVDKNSRFIPTLISRLRGHRKSTHSQPDDTIGIILLAMDFFLKGSVTLRQRAADVDKSSSILEELMRI